MPLPRPEALQPFEGTWRAVSLEVVETAPPNRSQELISLGASFTLDIQASGGYTAILTTDLGSSVEIGKLELQETSVTFLREYPDRSREQGTLELLSADTLRLSGATRFTFRIGESPVDARLDALMAR